MGLEDGEESWVGADGGSPESDRSTRRRPGSGSCSGQRWSAGRKRDVVLRLLRGDRCGVA